VVDARSYFHAYPYCFHVRTPIWIGLWVITCRILTEKTQIEIQVPLVLHLTRGACFSWSGQTLASHCGVSGSIQSDLMWDSWW
jgi:hypothetical protein